MQFPLLGLENIEAKIDTGAYSSAIHSHKIWTEIINDVTYLKFELFDPKDKNYRNLIIQTSNFERRKVRSSNGRSEWRYIIKTTVVIGGKKRKTDLSLTDRGKMNYSVLIGRKVLKKGFLIDVTMSHN